tara:strand:+ start:81 stop:317 length:237 start_codon:yes stop_codon:yes gene_type:complete
MEPHNKTNKSWKKIGKIVNTYDEALAAANALFQQSTTDDEMPAVEIKIKRCGPGGSQFKVKIWHPDNEKPKNNKKRKK